LECGDSSPLSVRTKASIEISSQYKCAAKAATSRRTPKRLLVFLVLLFSSSPASPKSFLRVFHFKKFLCRRAAGPLESATSFDLSGSTVCLIDLNQDGVFSPRWRLLTRFSGNGASPEQLKVIERLVAQIRKEMDERE